MDCLPHDLIAHIVGFCDTELKLNLIRTCSTMKWFVSKNLYKNIVFLDHEDYELHTSLTLVSVTKLGLFAACLTARNFMFMESLVFNSVETVPVCHLNALFAKLQGVCAQEPHPIQILNFDYRSLKLANPSQCLNSSNLLVENDDVLDEEFNRNACVLKNWYAFDMQQLRSAPVNPNLESLNILLESRAFALQDTRPTFLSSNLKLNLASLSSLQISSPHLFLQITECLRISELRLLLTRLSLTSAHRLFNDASLSFERVNLVFDLNKLHELELKLRCTCAHVCNNSCIVAFFDAWKKYNEVHRVETKIRSFALVNHKSLTTEISQFQTVIENYVLSPMFSNLSELMIDFGNLLRSINESDSLSLPNVLENMKHVPNLRYIHWPSFFEDAPRSLPAVFDCEMNYLDVLFNSCDCKCCERARAAIIELAKIDSANNFNHKVSFKDVTGVPHAVSHVDFLATANFRYIQFLLSQLRKQESLLEANLHTTGTMLEMKYMPMESNLELRSILDLLAHCCLRGLHEKMRLTNPQILVTLGGLSIAPTQNIS